MHRLPARSMPVVLQAQIGLVSRNGCAVVCHRMTGRSYPARPRAFCLAGESAGGHVSPGSTAPTSRCSGSGRGRRSCSRDRGDHLESVNRLDTFASDLRLHEGLTGKDLLRLLRKRGCVELRQKGSHVVVQCDKCQTVVPVHAGEDLGPGLLRAIERDLEPCLGKGWLRPHRS
jgi:predicted RNA binding protein YcfA (HicA-like mRNA interferase family)